jgi:uncharacterized protein YcbX
MSTQHDRDVYDQAVRAALDTYDAGTSQLRHDCDQAVKNAAEAFQAAFAAEAIAGWANRATLAALSFGVS